MTSISIPLRKLAAPLLGVAAALVLAACSASTSHIGDIQIGKDKDVTTAATTFGKSDELFAKIPCDNIAGKENVTVSLTAVNVQGMKPNTPVPGTDKVFDVDSDATISYHLTPPASGWPAGSYQVTVTMTEDGTKRDEKNAPFTVQ